MRLKGKNLSTLIKTEKRGQGIVSQDLWFSLKDFWYIPLVCGVFAMTAAALFGYFLKGKLLKIYTAVIFGAGICIYIQGTAHPGRTLLDYHNLYMYRIMSPEW